MRYSIATAPYGEYHQENTWSPLCNRGKRNLQTPSLGQCSVLQEAVKCQKEGEYLSGGYVMTVMEGHKDIAERICLVNAARIMLDIK